MLGATVAAKVGAMPGPSSHRGDTALRRIEHRIELA